STSGTASCRPRRPSTPSRSSSTCTRSANGERAPVSVEAPIAVVLMNMGGPDSLEAVEPFLYNLFRDHDLIPLPLGFLWQRRFAHGLARARQDAARVLQAHRRTLADRRDHRRAGVEARRAAERARRRRALF